MKVKSLWKGVFHLKCELKRKYAYAYTKDQAKVVMVNMLAKDQDVSPAIVMQYLKEHPDTYEIKLEVEWREEDDND